MKTVIAAAAILLLSPATEVLAEGYWSYQYQDFDVVAVGRSGGGRALDLAHHVARFHKALTQILRARDRPLPTHIYELPPKVLKQLIDSGGTSYHFNGYETTVVTDAPAGRDNPDWGALFGYTGSFLLSGGFARYPYWFLSGVPALFANTQFQVEHIETGGIEPGYARLLNLSSLIPMRVFLRIQGSDPQLRSSPTFTQMFFAESWYLSREVFVEGKLKPEFGKYLSLIQAGMSEEDAFSASFKLSYEDLDKLLHRDLSDQTHIYVVKVPREPPDNTQAHELSNAEVNARLADLSFEWGHDADALRMASQALDEEPANELALRVAARAKLRGGDFTAALATVDKLSALPSPSAAALTDSGDVLSQLSREVAAGHASLTVDAPSLHARAKAAFEHAISLDSEYLRAWAGLGYLYAAPAYADEAKTLLPRAQPVMEKHSYSGPLARAFSHMCAATGQVQCAYLFVEFWRSNAVTDRDLDQATELLAILQRVRASAR